MSTNMPGINLPDLREYLFIDEERVRLLVAQVREGAPQSTTTKTSRSNHLRVGLRTLGTERERASLSEDTLALSDLFVSMLEEDAEALGVLTDLSDRANERKFWLRGGLRKILEPGMLLRVTAPTRLMDASGLLEVLRRFDSASGQNSELPQMLAMVEALYGENLSVTVMPCGADYPESAFLGVIGKNTESAALDRASLLSRLGSDTPILTTIMQVSRVPTERDAATPSATLVRQATERMKRADGTVNRSAIDDFIFGMMRMTEDYGLQNTPKWPAVAITPLAIYRQVPQAPELNGD